jgi:hypothetical protein
LLGTRHELAQFFANASVIVSDENADATHIQMPQEGSSASLLPGPGARYQGFPDAALVRGP